MVAYPPDSREKGHPGRARKGNGNSRAESRGTHCYTQTPSTKSFLPTRSQIPQFFYQCLRAGHLSTCIIPCFRACFSNSRLSPSNPSSTPPAQTSTCALHSPHSSRHLKQLPSICCPPQFQHPGPTLVLPTPYLIKAGSVSLHCIFWSSTDLQTSRLCCELVCRSASISINDNAERKVLDSVGHLGFYLFNNHCYKVGWDGNPTAFL